MSRISLERWQQVEQVLDAALELPADQRAAYLDEACRDDPALHREVETMLAACADEEAFLETPAQDFAAGLIGDLHVERSSEERPAVGQRIGPYRVLRELGRGGMGDVYLAARDDDQFQRQVALKLVRRGMATDDVLRRFRSERQILASLDHSNIARLLDGGATDDGTPYFVMEYVEGRPIDRYCAERRLSVEARLALFCDVCAAVHFAHQNLVVHRDLKPANILVTAPPAGGAGHGVVKLLDFGVAKLLDQTAWPDDVPLTRTGVRVFTPEYASPEQVRGAAITTASDVYSLGVLLYELLTGQKPYRTERRTLSEIERAVCEEEPLRPSTVVTRLEAGTPTETRSATGRTAAAPERLRRQLAGDLDTIVLMALRKEPARRYPSAQQLREDLQRYLDGLPVRARGDTVVYRVAKFVRRNRIGVAVAATFVLLCLVFGVLYTVRVTAERDRARQEAAKAEQVKQFLLDLFEGADPYAEQRDTLRLRTFLDLSSARIARELRGQPEVRAELMNTMGQVYARLGLYDQAGVLLDSSLALRRARFGPAAPEVAEALHNAGMLRLYRGDPEEAERLLRASFTLLTAPEAAGERAQVMDDLAIALASRGAYVEAESLARESLALRRARAVHGTREDREGLASSLNNLALVLYDTDQREASQALYEESLVVHDSLYGRDHPQTAFTLNNLGLLYLERGDIAHAEPVLREVLDVRRRTLGPDHPDVAYGLNNVALVYYQQRDFARAADYIRQAYELRRRRQGPEHPLTIGLLSNLGMLEREQGDYEAAEATLREVLALQRRLQGHDHPDVARSFYNVGLVLHDTGRYEAAEASYRQALARQRATFPDPHSETAATLLKLGEVLVARGQPSAALPLLDESLSTWQQVVPEGHWRLGQARGVLGACLTALGRYAEAERSLLDSYQILQAQEGHDPAKHLRTTLQQLVSLYEAWGRPASAAPFRARLDG